MLNDPELSSIISSLETELGNTAKSESSVGILAGSFENITDAICESLRSVAAS
jgi:hypothetical protein